MPTSTYVRTGNNFKHERIEITDEINHENTFKFDMNNVAAQAGSFQECKAVRLNLKEQRVLNSQIHRLNAQMVECERSKQIHIRLTLLHYEKLQKRIAQLKSTLSADELQELRQLELSGQLAERSSSVGFNSARIIALAHRRIYHQAGAIPSSVISCRQSAVPPQDAAINLMMSTRAKSAVSFLKNDEETAIPEVDNVDNKFRSSTSLGFINKVYPATSNTHLISRARTAAPNHVQSFSDVRPKSSLSHNGHVEIYPQSAAVSKHNSFVPYKGIPIKLNQKLLQHRAVSAQASLKYRARNSQLIIEEKNKLNELAKNEIQKLLKTVDDMKLNTNSQSEKFQIFNK